jgi:hypothetical protein
MSKSKRCPTVWSIRTPLPRPEAETGRGKKALRPELDRGLRLKPHVVKGVREFAEGVGDTLAPSEAPCGVDERGSLLKLEVRGKHRFRYCAGAIEPSIDPSEECEQGLRRSLHSRGLRRTALRINELRNMSGARRSTGRPAAYGAIE